MAGVTRLAATLLGMALAVGSAVALPAVGAVPADKQLAVADMLRISDLPPSGEWSAGKLSTGPNTARCTIAGGGNRGATANAKQVFTGGGFQVLEAVQILKTESMIDREWRGANVRRLLSCLTKEVRVDARAAILESQVVHPNLFGVPSRMIALRVLFQPRITPPRVELEDIFVLLGGRTLVELAANGTYRSKSDALSGVSSQVEIESRLLQIISQRANLK